MRVQASGRVDQACECKQDFYSELKLTKDACSCQETWVYTGYDEKTYHGCVETYDWPGNTWCWVDGGPGGGKDCPGAAKGSLDIETRFWRTCDPKKGATARLCPRDHHATVVRPPCVATA